MKTTISLETIFFYDELMAVAAEAADRLPAPRSLRRAKRGTKKDALMTLETVTEQSRQRKTKHLLSSANIAASSARRLAPRALTPELPLPPANRARVLPPPPATHSRPLVSQSVLARVGLNHGLGLGWVQREMTAEQQKEAGLRLAFLRRTDPFDRSRVLL